MDMAKPDDVTKREIDIVISNMKKVLQDVTVLNNFSVGNDHRTAREQIVIKRERKIKENKDFVEKPLPHKVQTNTRNSQTYMYHKYK